MKHAKFPNKEIATAHSTIDRRWGEWLAAQIALAQNRALENLL